MKKVILYLLVLSMSSFVIELSSATQQTYKTKREFYAHKFSVEMGLDENLVLAIIAHESKNFPRAERNDRFRLTNQQWVKDVIKTHNIDTMEDEVFFSQGYFQLLFLTAVDMGFIKWCIDRQIRPVPSALLDIETNIYWGAKFLKLRCMSRYTKLEDIISAYNQGNNGWYDLDGDKIKDDNEVYKNQKYVNEVMAKYKELNK